MSRNRLAEETSPYLLQHKENPVHWWAWGPEAIAEAKATGKPILLSVGYAACHWCHVMAHESFEDEPTAKVMNELFINVKVDREERPDVDAIYMSALHQLGEQGGWPLTMFLDGEARPFFGGTYFPKDAKFGRPAFVQVLNTVSQIYLNEPEKAAHNANAIMADLETLTRTKPSTKRVIVTNSMQKDLCGRMIQAIDTTHGGIQGAPKFPQWSFFWLMWRGAIRFRNENAKTAVLTTLTNICQGGIYDHIGGGFARYSVDEIWLVPHFEKMLYDNALLVDLLTEAWRETQDPIYAQRISETVEWLRREMIADGGGFAASLDADSEGVEGKFYVWSKAEIETTLGEDDAEFFCRHYDISTSGNFEGANISNRLESKTWLGEMDEKRLESLRAKLFETRKSRIHPGWDDKVLSDWNGMMIAALANAGQTFDRPDWIKTAITAFDFVIGNMVVDGRLQHAWRVGRCNAPGTASDHANMIWGALRLYQATADRRFLDQAETMTRSLNTHHWLAAEHRFATSADDTDDVIVRLATGTDDATPNANGVMVSNLASLTLLTGNLDYVQQAAQIVDSFGPEMASNLIGYTGLLAAEYDLSRPQIVAIFSPDGETDLSEQAMDQALKTVSLPGALQFRFKGAPDDLPPALKGKTPVDGVATAYMCIGPQCSLPVTKPEALLQELRALRAQPDTA
ncbi:MAG: thioredoxin domain-containing protein [Pseudomonadota bacterium]